jgi:CRP-like cAMP-binding protein
MVSREMPNNLILRSLPPDAFAHLQRHLTPISLRERSVVHPLGEPISDVFFVETGMVSLILLSQGGGGIETGVVGAEGMVGALIALGSPRSPIQAAVQISGHAFKCSAAAFLDSYQTTPAMREQVNLSIAHTLLQAQQNALCHALHSVEARLCRWLLQTQDLVHSNVLNLTQEFLSNMLGVQRTSVSITAHALQQQGLIRYRRGHIQILNRPRIEECACECYSALSRKLLVMSHKAMQPGPAQMMR